MHSAEGDPVSVAGRVGAGYRLADDDLDGYVVLDFDAFDWLEEDEPIAGHPRDPYHRVDVRRSLRTVRIELDGEVIAETTGARLLCETSLPMRFYVPREDVRAELRASPSRSYCPYKGEASWWSIEGHEDIGWTYEQPMPELPRSPAWWRSGTSASTSSSTASRGERPGSVFSEVLLEEFGALEPAPAARELEEPLGRGVDLLGRGPLVGLVGLGGLARAPDDRRRRAVGGREGGGVGEVGEARAPDEPATSAADRTTDRPDRWTPAAGRGSARS